MYSPGFLHRPNSFIKKYFNDPLIVNSYFIMTYSILNIGTGFFFWIIATRFYSADQVGFCSALLSISTLIGLFSLLGFDIGIIHFLNKENDKTGFINMSFSVVGITTIVFSLFYIVGITFWSPKLVIIQHDLVLALIFVSFTLLNTFYTLQWNVFVGIRKSVYTAILGLVSSLRLVILPILIIGTIGIYVSLGLAIFLSLMTGFLLLYKIFPGYKIFPSLNFKLLNKTYSYSINNYISNIFYSLPSLLFPIIIINSTNLSNNAYYYIAWTVTGIIQMIPIAVSRSLLAEGSHSQTDLNKFVKKSLTYTFVFMCIGIFFLILIGKYILGIFGNDYVENSYNLLILLCVSNIPFMINIIYVTTKRIKNELKEVILIYGVIAVVSLLIGYILINNVGITGIGYAWLIANTIISFYIVLKFLLYDLQIYRIVYNSFFYSLYV